MKKTKNQTPIEESETYLVNIDFLNLSLRIDFDHGAGLQLIQIAIEELKQKEQISDNVKEYLIRALQTLLDTAQSDKGRKIHPGKAVCDALGYRRHSMRTKMDYAVVGAEVEHELSTNNDTPLDAIYLKIGKKFGISKATARNYHQKKLEDQKLFDLIKHKSMSASKIQKY
jgi:hypothetical protein